jgi:hypothetical protein
VQELHYHHVINMDKGVTNMNLTVPPGRQKQWRALRLPLGC